MEKKDSGLTGLIILRNKLTEKIVKDLVEGITEGMSEFFKENLYMWVFSGLCDDCIKKIAEKEGIEK